MPNRQYFKSFTEPIQTSMHVTLHLTTGCNMSCSYCYSPPAGETGHDMTPEIAEKAVLLASSFSPANTGVIFFGGEPLLRTDLIERTVSFCRRHERTTGASFHFKVTTNGLKLDRNFLEFAARERIQVALSIDGIKESHDRHRKTIGGKDTFSIIAEKIPLLLQYAPYASAFMTVTPETVEHYASSVDSLFERGFRYIISSLNFAGNWTDAGLRKLRKEYHKLAQWYESHVLQERKFYFSPFEKKLASHILGKDALCQQCHFGIRQISIAPDGSIYPCVQFVKDGLSNKSFVMGDVWRGIDGTKQQAFFEMSRRAVETCESCALNERCEHRCSCLNWQTTGSLDGVSPVLCESERALIPIVDRLGERLYRKAAPLFIQKHYNAVYPLISYLEDRGL